MDNHLQNNSLVTTEQRVAGGLLDASSSPTRENVPSLRRVSDGIPWSVYLIVFVEAAERFSFYGSSIVFTNFIQRKLPPGSTTGAAGLHGQAGALGKGQRDSTALTTFYLFWCYATPLLGAYIADAHLGRFKTIWWAIFVALTGHIILIASALPGVIDSEAAIGVFIVAIIITGLGAGMFKANVSPLVAEQYTRTEPFVKKMKSGELVLVDPSMTILRIYMYYYFMINAGGIIGTISMTYSEKFVGFYLSYTIPTVIFLVCPIVLFISRDMYKHTPPAKSALPRAIRLWRYAAKDKWSRNPIKLYRNFTSSGFWDTVLPSEAGEKRRPPWMNQIDDKWIEEVVAGFKACSVFLWYPLYWLTYNQLTGNLTSQAATLTLHGLPNDILSNLDPLTVAVLIPICDLLIYPTIERFGLNFTALKKITTGFMLGSVAMAWAAVLQHYIYKTSPCGYHASECEGVSPLSVWIQSGAYILNGMSEVLASITGLQYAFTKAPKNMKSLVMSLFLFMTAISSALGEAFVSLSGDPLLVWNYGAISVLIFLSGCLFWRSVRHLDKQESTSLRREVEKNSGG